MRYTIFAITIIFLYNSLNAQTDTTIAEVGSDACLIFKLKDENIKNSKLVLSGIIKIDNPTLFYPEKFSVPSNFQILEQTIDRIDDSSRSFSILLNNDSGADSLNLSICGTVLAGAYALCEITIDSLELSGKSSTLSFSSVLLAQSIGAPLTYVRFAFLNEGYPNPVFDNGFIKFVYRIDAISDIIFIIYDDRGKEIYYFDDGVKPIGYHDFNFQIPNIIASGIYLIRMKTNSGESIRNFLIIK